ncbi:MAG: HAMP domain-containing protein, partial [Chloroflexota bacterium]
NIWLEALQKIRGYSPETSLLFATDRSDPSLILRAKTLGAKNFLRAPYDEEGLQHALSRMEALAKKRRSSIRDRLPRIRTPIRVKIILPFIIMAIIIGFGVAFVVNGSARNSAKERFINQLINAGKQSADWMVREEDRLLSTLRLLSNTQGMAEAISQGDTERLRELALPVAINNQEKAVEILDANGFGLIGLRQDTDSGELLYASGEGQFATLDFVRAIINGQSDQTGDKYAGLAAVGEETYFYVSGAVRDELGNVVGVILVGNSAYSLAREMQENTVAHITLYDAQGTILSYTLAGSAEERKSLTEPEVAKILAGKEEASLIKGYSHSGEDYREILSAWEARGDQDLGVIGVAQSEAIFVVSTESATGQIFVLLTSAFFFVILFGLLVARRISKPLMQVVEASTEVARGNFDVRLPITGDDEISVLAHSFNRMVVGLKDGMLYRNLLGLTVSPEVRDQLRSNLATGDLQIQGQFAIATILMVDIHEFTTISEREDPTTIMNWLNELFGELVPIFSSYEGVVNEISGDALFAFFGILPQPQEAAESAYLACQAGVEMLEAIERINWRRAERGDVPLTIGIGINTGPVTAGGLGAQDRLHYTVIGDAVNTAQRIEGLAHQFNESGVMISKQTLIAMWDRRDQFNIESHGNVNVKGKLEELEVYRLW